MVEILSEYIIPQTALCIIGSDCIYVKEKKKKKKNVFDTKFRATQYSIQINNSYKKKQQQQKTGDIKFSAHGTFLE